MLKRVPWVSETLNFRHLNSVETMGTLEIGLNAFLHYDILQLTGTREWKVAVLIRIAPIAHWMLVTRDVAVLERIRCGLVEGCVSLRVIGLEVQKPMPRPCLPLRRGLGCSSALLLQHYACCLASHQGDNELHFWNCKQVAWVMVCLHSNRTAT